MRVGFVYKKNTPDENPEYFLFYLDKSSIIFAFNSGPLKS